MISQLLNINWTAVFTTVGFVIAAYIMFIVLIGLLKGWSVVGKVWFWTKKLWWLAFVIIGLILVASSLKGKKKRDEELTGKIAELRQIENKTFEDNRKLAELENERKRGEQEIIDITKKYQKKVEKLKEKPPSDPKDPSKDPKPGDAASSSDAMNDSWK